MVQVPTAGFKYLCALKEWVCREFQKLNGLLCGPSSPADQEEGCWNIQTPFHLLSLKSCPALSESHAFHSHAGSIWYLSHFLAKYFFTGWFFFGFVVNCSHKNISNFFFFFSRVYFSSWARSLKLSADSKEIMLYYVKQSPLKPKSPSVQLFSLHVNIQLQCLIMNLMDELLEFCRGIWLQNGKIIFFIPSCCWITSWMVWDDAFHRQVQTLVSMWD